MKTNKLLLLTIGLMLLIIGIQHKQLQDANSKLTKVIDQKDIGGGIVRSSTSVGTSADIDSMALDAGVDISRIRSDATDNGAVVTGINVTTANTSGSNSTNVRSSRSKPRTDVAQPNFGSCVCPPNQGSSSDIKIPPPTAPACAPGRYENSEQVLDINEPVTDQNIPFGEVTFKAWKEDPWSLSVFPRSYKSSVVFAEDDDGRKIAYSHMEIIQGDNKVTLPISTAEMVMTPKPAKFRWASRLHLGVSGGIHTTLGITGNAGLAFYFANYGSDKFLPDFTFIGAGLGYDFLNSSPVISLNPASYRIGQHLPFVQDLYLSPQLTLDLSLKVGLLVSISTAL
jgi:hypothetical protein